MVPTIEWKRGRVRMLDQRRLPQRVLFLEYKDYKGVAQAIKKMVIRGAPAIGIAAAMGVALGAQKIKVKTFEEFYNRLIIICEHLAGTRPTAVNLFWAIKRMRALVEINKDKKVQDIKRLLITEALNILKEDVEINRAIGRNGAPFIKDGDTILTHCNAGALATGGYGTALGVIRTAWEEGKRIHAYADETRPVLQGARLTVWELMQDGIPVTLITDNMAGYLMKRGKINLCIVGADRIAANGDTANKIGTYSVAVLAKEHGIPFYVAAPLSTIDPTISSGDEIPIEERDQREVTHIWGRVQIAPKDVRVVNPAFDVTPASYITAIITEKGAFQPSEIKGLFI